MESRSAQGPGSKCKSKDCWNKEKIVMHVCVRDPPLRPVFMWHGFDNALEVYICSPTEVLAMNVSDSL